MKYIIEQAAPVLAARIIEEMVGLMNCGEVPETAASWDEVVAAHPDAVTLGAEFAVMMLEGTDDAVPYVKAAQTIVGAYMAEVQRQVRLKEHWMVALDRKDAEDGR